MLYEVLIKHMLMSEIVLQSTGINIPFYVVFFFLFKIEFNFKDRCKIKGIIQGGLKLYSCMYSNTRFSLFPELNVKSSMAVNGG